jgi:hypothetical protein
MFWSGSSYDGHANQQTHKVVPESPTPEYIQKLKDALRHSSSITILVHMNGCPACVAFKPEWQKFAKKAQNQTSTIVATPSVYDRLQDNNVFGRATPDVRNVPEVLIVNKDLPLTARWSKFRDIHGVSPTHNNLLNFFSMFRNKANDAREERELDIDMDKEQLKKMHNVEAELENGRRRQVAELELKNEGEVSKERVDNIQRANDMNKYRISWSSYST